MLKDVSRRSWLVLALLVPAGGATVALLGTRPPEEFPLADRVPSDAVLYAGFHDYRRIEELAARLPSGWTAELRRGLEEARPHLAGNAAFYLDRELEWVFLARLTRTAAALSRGETDGGAAVFAQTPAALARHRARRVPLAELEIFQELRSRLFVNLERLRLPGRLGDFRALGLELEGTDPWVLRGRARYRSAVYRLYLEEYARTPGRGAPRGGGPVSASLAGSFARLWDDVLGALPPAERERAEREASALSRDYLGGRSLREFFLRVGPACGMTAIPSADGGLPALVAWVDLPDDGARETLARMLPRAARDARLEVREEEGVARVRFPQADALALGDAFAPCYRFEGTRLILSTSPSARSAPPVPAGDAHAAISFEIGPALQLARSLAPFLADRALGSGGDLRELRKTPRYAEELARQRERIETWADALGWLERAEWAGRFTGDGLAFELRAYRAP
jgi:hypothetical protein